MAITVSGTVYTDEGVTPIGSGRTINVSVNGAASAASATTASDGTFTTGSFTAAAGAVLTVYLQGNTEVGACVTKSTNAAMTGVDGYQDGLNVRSDNAVLTGTNINTSDNNGATGISGIYSSAGNTAFALASGKNLYIQSGQTYNPGVSVVATVPGSLSCRGTITTGQFTFTGTGTIRSNGQTVSGITINTAGTLTLADAAITGPLAFTTGTLDVSASNFQITCISTWSGTGVFVCRQGTVVFSDINGTTRTVNASATGSFYNVTRIGSSAGILQLTGNMTVTNNLTLSGSIFDLNGKTLSVGGNFTNNATFTHNNGTVTLNGAGGTTQTLSGSTAFYTLTATAAAARSITFTDGTTTTVSNSLTLTGSAGQLLTLQGSSTAGWTLAVPSTQSVSYVNISRCTATGNALLAGVGSVDGGNNVNVTFIPSNSVAPSTAPSSGTTADSYVCSSGTWANTPTTWLWETNKDSAGWVTASTSQNPTLTIAAAGTYQTRLTATNAAGSSSPVAGTTITVSAATSGNTAAVRGGALCGISAGI